MIVEIRGKGLLIGVKLHERANNRRFMVLAREKRLLIAGGSENCIRLLPAYIMTVEEAREAIGKLEATCEAARAEAAHGRRRAAARSEPRPRRSRE